MNETILATVGYIMWTIVLLILLAVYRNVVKKQDDPKSLRFDPNGNDLPDLGKRITRAHANCYESAIVVVAPMLLALATSSSAITDSLALLMLAARIAQSIVHIISVRNLAITCRFVLFVIQLCISAYWLFMFIQKFA